MYSGIANAGLFDEAELCINEDGSWRQGWGKQLVYNQTLTVLKGHLNIVYEFVGFLCSTHDICYMQKHKM